jgi:hypothetical protein
MSVSAVTTNYGFRLIDYATDPYVDDEWFNLRLLDGLLSGAQATIPFVVATGAVNTYAALYAPVPTLTVGLTLAFKTNAANTGACTFNPNALGAAPLKVNGSDPAANAFLSGMYLKVVWDGTNWNVVYPSFTVSPGAKITTAASGAVADVLADDLVIENNNDVGLSLLSPINKFSRYYFGTPVKPDAGGIVYDHSVDRMYFRANQQNGPYVDTGKLVRQPTLPVFWAYKTVSAAAAFPVVPSTFIANTELVDQGNNYDNTTGEFTAPVAGLYEFNFNYYNLANLATSCDWKTGVMVNGVQTGPTFEITSSSTTGNPNKANVNIVLSLSAGDKVKINLLAGSTGDISPTTGVYQFIFSGKMLP